MAGFRKHIEVASVGCGIIASSLLGAKIASPSEALTLWLAGTAGGILPDIDSDNSAALDLIFGILSFGAMCLILSQFAWRFSVLEIWLVLAFSFLGLNYGVRKVFEYFTVHRGVFHSLLSGCFFYFATTSFAYSVMGFTSFMAWLMGSFVFMGFVIHLVLDELYSVDLSNVRIKRSFGTALKLFEYGNIKVSLAMLAVTVGIFYLTPPFDNFANMAGSVDTFDMIKSRFFPEYLL